MGLMISESAQALVDLAKTSAPSQALDQLTGAFIGQVANQFGLNQPPDPLATPVSVGAWALAS